MPSHTKICGTKYGCNCVSGFYDVNHAVIECKEINLANYKRGAEILCLPCGGFDGACGVKKYDWPKEDRGWVSEFGDEWISVENVVNAYQFGKALEQTRVIYLISENMIVKECSLNLVPSHLAFIGVKSFVSCRPCDPEVVYVGLRKSGGVWDSIVFTRGCKDYDGSYEYFVTKKRKMYFDLEAGRMGGFFGQLHNCVLGCLEFCTYQNVEIGDIGEESLPVGILCGNLVGCLVESVDLRVSNVLIRADVAGGMFGFVNRSKVKRCTFMAKSNDGDYSKLEYGDCTLAIRQIGDLGRSRGARVHHASVGQSLLQLDASQSLLARGFDAAFHLGRVRVAHRVRLIEGDHAVEVLAQPFDQSVDVLRRRRVQRTRSQRRERHEHRAFARRVGPVQDLEVMQPRVGVHAQVGEIALGGVDQAGRLADPDGFLASLIPVVLDHATDFASLARAGAVTRERSAPLRFLAFGGR